MKNKSFTLIELLVVIVIIGILAGVIIVSVSSSINKANFAKAQAFSNTVQNELLGDLVSEWTFDNASLPGEDSWGNNDLSIYGASYESNCFSIGCLNFDTMDDYATSSLVYNNLHAFTLSAWINPSNLSFSYIRTIVGTIAGNNGRSMLVVSGNRIRFHNYNAGDYGISSDSDVVNLNEWQHVVVTYDNSNVKLYHNGSQVGGGVYLKQDTNETMIIGRVLNISVEYDRRFEGEIDDVRIYKDVLAASQIKKQYIAGLNSLLAKGSISKEEYEQRLNNLAYEK